MATPKKKDKLKLDDVAEKVTHPWQAWFHVTKQRKFYTNVETKVSVWEHPLEKQPKAEKVEVSSFRKQREGKEPAGEPMEVEQVQLKRQSRCEPEVERNLVIKRSRIEEENVETIPKTKAPATSSPIRSASPIIPTILPNVSWSAKIRPYKIIPYRACAIFDTCSLIKNCAVLDDAVEKQILSVIPYSVICELDGLKNNSDLRPAAQEVNWKLKELCNEKNHYLHIETSVEQCIAVPEYMANPSVKDDLILKCALRIKKEVASIVDTLKLNEAAILFVTDDTNLGLKADAHGMIVENVEDFLNVINDRPKAPPKKKAERRSVPEDLYREPRNSYSNQAVRKGYPVRNNRSSAQYEERKSITAMKLEETRKGKEWIMMIARRAAEKERLMTPERKIAETETKPRPTVPLVDELSPIKETPKRLCANHQNYAKFPRIPHFESKTIKKPEPSKSRPQIPCVSSDEDDSMDCT